MKSAFVLRVRILSGLFILAALVLVVRLYFVQIVHGEEHRRSAEGQYVASASGTERRGDIFFMKKDGTEVAAAVMQSGWRLALAPDELDNPERVFEALNALTPVNRERFFAAAAKKGDPYEEIASRVADEAGPAIRALELDGVLLDREEWRMYPAKDLAAHVVGFAGFDGDRRKGTYGLEKYYEDTLRRDLSGLFVNPFAEIFANMAAALSSDPSAHEGNVVTTIEPDVQIELERELGEIATAYAPKQIGAVIMDPQTGAIIALAALPDFDPNSYGSETSFSVFSNPLIERRYEMGSIMKPLTVAAGIDAGAITAGTTYDDKGYIMKSGFRISNYDGRGRGVVPMQEILSQSLNTGVSFIVDKMGHDDFTDYFTAFGLGEETGIDLPNEIPGNLAALTNAGASDVDFASASFGQGIAVTPIAMVRALAALGNGGVLPEPHVAESVRYDSGVVRSITQAPPTRVLKEETARVVTDMLIKVFDDALLEGELKMERYSIAAKTGTAQIGDPSCGGYCEGRYLHSFFGYFPAHDPRFIVLLYQVEPQGVQYASQSLARPFMDIAKFLINYYDIPPDR